MVLRTFEWDACVCGCDVNPDFDRLRFKKHLESFVLNIYCNVVSACCERESVCHTCFNVFINTDVA